MAEKKYYAVKKGKITGVFNSWQECKDSVDGYPGAEYKGFKDLEEVKAYLGELYCLRFVEAADPVPKERFRKKDTELQERTEEAFAEHKEQPEEGWLLAYVDGSYEDALKKYAFGCVFLLPDGRIFVEYGNGDDPQSLQHRNITGEMLGAMFAVQFARLNGFQGVEIRYDYEGIEKWVTGVWRSKTERTAEYAKAMREWGKSIQLLFSKVQAHSNIYYNELADKMAKTGLKKGSGVPGLRLIEDMEEYHGTDETE